MSRTKQIEALETEVKSLRQKNKALRAVYEEAWHLLSHHPELEKDDWCGVELAAACAAYEEVAFDRPIPERLQQRMSVLKAMVGQRRVTGKVPRTQAPKRGNR